MVELISIVSKSMILGFSTGITCTVTCLPLLIPTLFSQDQKKFGRISLALIRFLIGRFVAYLMFGLVAGVAGVFLADFDGFQNIVIPAIYLIIGGMMVVYGIVGVLKHYNACKTVNRKFQNPNYLFVLGFLMGVNICPPFFLAFGAATGFEDVLKSVLFFVVFFFATSVFFLPLLFSGFAAKVKMINKVSRYGSIISGAYFMYLAIHTILVLQGVIEVVY